MISCHLHGTVVVTATVRENDERVQIDRLQLHADENKLINDSQVRWDFKYQMNGRLIRPGTKHNERAIGLFILMLIHCASATVATAIYAFFSHETIHLEIVLQNDTKCLNGN